MTGTNNAPAVSEALNTMIVNMSINQAGSRFSRKSTPGYDFYNLSGESMALMIILFATDFYNTEVIVTLSLKSL
jgi:hypothetical protein